jgi:hypothetical protein
MNGILERLRGKCHKVKMIDEDGRRIVAAERVVGLCERVTEKM